MTSEGNSKKRHVKELKKKEDKPRQELNKSNKIDKMKNKEELNS
jgi:hypothetical protein